MKNGYQTPPQVISHESVSGSKAVGLRTNFRATKLMIRQTALPLSKIVGIYISYHSNDMNKLLSSYGGQYISVPWVKLSPIIMNTVPLFFCDTNLSTDKVRSMMGTHYMKKCKKPK